MSNRPFDDTFWWTRKPTERLRPKGAIVSQASQAEAIGVVQLREGEVVTPGTVVVLDETLRPLLDIPLAARTVAILDADGGHLATLSPATPGAELQARISEEVAKTPRPMKHESVEIVAESEEEFDEQAAAAGLSVSSEVKKKLGIKFGLGRKTRYFIGWDEKRFAAKIAPSDVIRQVSAVFGADADPEELERQLLEDGNPRVPGIVQIVEYAWTSMVCIRTLNESDAADEEYKAKVDEARHLSEGGAWVRPKSPCKQCGVTLTDSGNSGREVPVSARLGIVDGSGRLVPAFLPPTRQMTVPTVALPRRSVTELHEAVQRCDPVEIWKFADQASLINARDEHGRTALAWGACVGNLPALKALVAMGSDVNAVDDDGNSVLLLAVQHGHLTAVQLLAKQHADLGQANKDGLTPLHAATLGRHVAIARELLERGADVKAMTTDGRSPLTLAARAGHLELVRMLVEADAELDVTESDGSTALMLAAKCNNLQITEVLLGAGASTEIKLPDGRTALDLAGKRGKVREAISRAVVAPQ